MSKKDHGNSVSHKSRSFSTTSKEKSLMRMLAVQLWFWRVYEQFFLSLLTVPCYMGIPWEISTNCCGLSSLSSRCLGRLRVYRVKCASLSWCWVLFVDLWLMAFGNGLYETELGQYIKINVCIVSWHWLRGPNRVAVVSVMIPIINASFTQPGTIGTLYLRSTLVLLPAVR